MALKFNNVAPTEIIVKRSDQEPISFASGSTYVTPKNKDNEGYWIAEALFTQHTDFTLGNIVYCNGEELTSYPHVMHTITRDNTTYTFSAAYHESTSQIYTTQKVVKRIRSNAGLTVYGENYTGMFTADTNLTVLKYSVREEYLRGEATRDSVSSYSKAELDGYVGLVNDTWGGITNASSLTKYKYYYIRVLVTDTNRYGKFCVRFKSSNGQTITVDNMGWGYDGEFIAGIPVWGKPFKLTVTQIQGGDLIIVPMITRIDSPNQHAATGDGAESIITNNENNIVYYGDTVHVRATAIGGYDHYKIQMNVNGTIYTGNVGELLEKDITITDTTNIAFSDIYVPYMHELWTGSYSVEAKNKKITANWPVTLPGGVTSVSINVNFSFRGKNVSGTYTVNNSGTNASEFIKYSGVSKTTMTISWKDSSSFYFESTGNGYSATATISSISCVY